MLRLPEHLRFIRSASSVADVAEYWTLLYVVGGDRFRAELARVAELLVSNGWHFESIVLLRPLLESRRSGRRRGSAPDSGSLTGLGDRDRVVDQVHLAVSSSGE